MTSTYADILHAPSWPRRGYLLPDGRRVVGAWSNGTLWGRGLIHLCLDDGTCTVDQANRPLIPVDTADDN